HRTCPLDAPENSLAGLRKAAELGADGVEIGVRRTLERLPGRPHDPLAPRRDDPDHEGERRFLDDAAAFGARAISGHWAAITPQFVGEAHERKLRVYSWNRRDLDNLVKKV